MGMGEGCEQEDTRGLGMGVGEPSGKGRGDCSACLAALPGALGNHPGLPTGEGRKSPPETSCVQEPRAGRGGGGRVEGALPSRLSLIPAVSGCRWEGLIRDPAAEIRPQ